MIAKKKKDRGRETDGPRVPRWKKKEPHRSAQFECKASRKHAQARDSLQVKTVFCFLFGE